MMKQQELEEIEARLRTASKLWFAPGYQKPELITNAVEDLVLIAHAPADIFVLLGEVKRLQTFALRVVEMYREAQTRIINNSTGNDTVKRSYLAQEIAILKNEIGAQQEATP